MEEPEAHLFPDAQSQLIELLSILANLYNGTVDLVLTTHSPYVLAKFNNLIKAGQVGRQDKYKASVREIVNEDSWLKRNQLGAYALIEGEAQPIIDDSGLINGDYLDAVSDCISTEFSKLLGVEFAEGKLAS